MRLNADSGVFVVADVVTVETRWAHPVGMQGNCVIDLTGTKAESHATRLGGSSAKKLADGTWRLSGFTAQRAQYVVTELNTIAGRNRDDVLARAHPADATTEQVRDAVRGGDAGHIPTPGLVALAAPNGVEVTVTERDKDGRATTITIKAL
jgi:hypothetical protein